MGPTLNFPVSDQKPEQIKYYFPKDWNVFKFQRILLNLVNILFPLLCKHRIWIKNNWIVESMAISSEKLLLSLFMALDSLVHVHLDARRDLFGIDNQGNVL